MWVRFTADYDFSPEARAGRVTIAYKAGMVMNVTRECSEKAKAANAGKPTAKAESVEQPELGDTSPLDAGDEGHGAVFGSQDR